MDMDTIRSNAVVLEAFLCSVAVETAIVATKSLVCSLLMGVFVSEETGLVYLNVVLKLLIASFLKIIVRGFQWGLENKGRFVLESLYFLFWSHWVQKKADMSKSTPVL
ncbi:hypothetical protein FH972_013119 [Carpinus fangiana]|uniref:Uncharacterized protein n=1 Tax=Carpinus fangiana TaxID=176857 RepID=A0A5N6R956_9ROSI|nr:hypothetical protein FH972_013119 [Carpinus fangiana]